MSEFELHVACAQFLDLALPGGACWFHAANGERRHISTAKRLKRMGVKPGIPDLCIIYRGESYFIELKAGKNTVSKAQKAMQARLLSAGAVVFRDCRSVEELQNWLTVFMPLKARAT